MRLLSILAAALAAFGQAPGSISGRVVDLVTGEGLPGAQVSLGFGEVSTTAGENEPYQLEHLKPGEYHFCSFKAGRGAEIIVLGPGQSTIDILGSLTLGGNGELHPDAGTFPPAINVAGNSIRLGPRSTVNAFITAPGALMRLGRSAVLHGSFCVDVIGSDNRALLACP